MSSMIGALRIALQLDSVAFERGAKRSAAEIDALGSRAEKMGHRVGTGMKAATAAVGVLAGSALISGLKNVVEQGLAHAAALGEQAEQLGVTAKELQEYRYAASQAGIETSEMDAGLTNLTRTIGEAALGSKAQSEAFKRLGIDIRDANGGIKSAGDLIPEIADAMTKLHSPTERAAALVDLFGKAGQKMSPLLNGGAAGVNNLRDAAQRLGVVLSDKQIQSADETADKLDALKQVITSKISGEVAENVDAIMALANAFSTLIDKAGAAVRAWQSWRKEVANRQDQNTVDGWFSSQQAKEEARARINSRNSEASTSRVIVPGDNIGNWRTATPARVLPKVVSPWASSRAGGLPAPNRLTGSGGRFSDIRTGGLGASVLFEAQQDSREDDWTGKARQSMIKYREELEGLKLKNATTTTALKAHWLDAAGTIVGSLQNMKYAFSGGDFLSKVQAVLGIAQTLARLGVFGAKAQGRVQGEAIRAYAGGTSFHPGGLALVGEKGPEIVDMPRGSKVYPNGTGPAPTSHIQVVPSPYFNVIVDGRVHGAAPAISTLTQRQARWRQGRIL